MADIVSPEKRADMMKHIPSFGTGPEIYFRKLLYTAGIRYRLKMATVMGHPDIYVPKYKTAVFIHGCYWHRHDHCQYAYTPKTRVEFWQTKFSSNVQRDLVVKKFLYEQEIKCLVVWECTIRRMKRDENLKHSVIDRALAFLQNEQLYQEL